jgi:hypothetical protein
MWAVVAEEFDKARERSADFVDYGAAVDVALIDLRERIVKALNGAFE